MTDQPEHDENVGLSLREAADRLGAAKLRLRPRFMADGRIRAGIGSYQLARDKDSVEVLLFTMVPCELRQCTENPEKINTKDGPQAYVVRAENALNQEWVYAAILKHQARLAQYCMKNTTLYQTDNFTWQSGPVAYRLFPCDEQPTNERGETLYRLRLFSEMADGESFTNVENQAPKGFLNQALSLGIEQGTGTLTRAEAEKLIAQDFTKRVNRIRTGEDPITPEERANKPAWTAIRKWQSFVHYWKQTDTRQKLADTLKIGVKISEGIGGLLLGFLESSETSKGRLRAARRHLQQKTGGYGLLPEKGLPPADQLLIPLDGRKARKLQLLTDREAGARPEDAPVHADTPRSWAADWIMMGLFGPSGSLVRFRKDGGITIERSNGIVLDVMPDHRESFARYIPELAQKGARNLPSAVQELLAEDKVLHLMLKKGRVQARHIKYETYLKHRAERLAAFRYRRPSGTHPVSNDGLSARKRFEAARDRQNAKVTAQAAATKTTVTKPKPEAPKPAPQNKSQPTPTPKP